MKKRAIRVMPEQVERLAKLVNSTLIHRRAGLYLDLAAERGLDPERIVSGLEYAKATSAEIEQVMSSAIASAEPVRPRFHTGLIRRQLLGDPDSLERLTGRKLERQLPWDKVATLSEYTTRPVDETLRFWNFIYRELGELVRIRRTLGTMAHTNPDEYRAIGQSAKVVDAKISDFQTFIAKFDVPENYLPASGLPEEREAFFYALVVEAQELFTKAVDLRLSHFGQMTPEVIQTCVRLTDLHEFIRRSGFEFSYQIAPFACRLFEILDIDVINPLLWPKAA
jgi:hypothetical protein